jgi:hypothetical protein
MTTPNISLVSGSENASVSGTTKSGNVNGSAIIKNGGITKGGGTEASINMQGLLLTFNLHIHASAPWMCRSIMVTQGVTEAQVV